MSNIDNSGSTLSILTLGDGDFTYSLDLARYFSLHGHETKVQLFCTSFDSQEELLAKYKDSPYILRQLLSLQNPKLSISILHGINAIAGFEARIGHVDHVMFHHPHLGIEDAVLHGRFLCHFFHSCIHGWMTPKGGLVHLTLVDGQFDRWNCEKAAINQGLKLVERKPFLPPPVDHPSYQYRRHQTGKSFESRRPQGSETFVFGRIESQRIIPSNLFQASPDPSPSVAIDDLNSQQQRLDLAAPQVAGLECPFCDRVFKEERSRRCHLRDKHPNGADKKAKTNDGTITLECIHCATETKESRQFTSEQALQDHIRAKHVAIHKTVIPDWCQKEDAPLISSGTDDANEHNGASSCHICGMLFTRKDQEVKHLDDFKPIIPDKEFECSFCTKKFRETRAKLQHENFCSSKPLQ